MKKQRTIIIGDVHGCLAELENLLKKVDYRPQKDQLIFVGDLINKGPHSLEVLQKVLNLQAEVIMGNHEFGFLQHLKDGSYPLKEFFHLKEQMGKHLKFWKNWLTQRPVYIEKEHFLVVHAGLAPNQHPAQTSPRILMNIRTWDGTGENLNNPKDPAWFDLHKPSKLVVFGHWAKQGLVLKKNIIGLDTGCVYGNKLSALLLPEQTIYQVPAQKIYVPL